MSKNPETLLYKIGELSKELGVETHVIRFWEREFPQVEPLKMPGRKHLYKPRDLKIFKEIKRLLYEEKYTIAGARKQLESYDFRQLKFFEVPKADEKINKISSIDRILNSVKKTDNSLKNNEASLKNLNLKTDIKELLTEIKDILINKK